MVIIQIVILEMFNPKRTRFIELARALTFFILIDNQRLLRKFNYTYYNPTTFYTWLIAHITRAHGCIFLVNSMEKLNWIIKTSKLQMKTTTNNYAYLCSFNWSLFHSICFILGLFSFFSAIYNVIGALNDRSWESNEPILWFSILQNRKISQWFFF